MKITIETEKDEKGYIAKVLELDCYGDGETELKAIEDVTSVMLDVLQLADSDGLIKLGK